MSDVRHRLVIRHPSQPAILVVDDHGAPRLPAFTSPDRHTAEVEYINRAVRERFGLTTTILKSLSHSDPHGDVVVRVHELETHGDGTLWSNALSWCERAALPSLPDAEDRAAIADWQAGETTHPSVVDGREWTNPGWLDEVRGWIERALSVAGLGAVREIIQLRAWMSSCVLRVHTTGGDCYFKAVPESLRRECAVTSYLARHFPDAVPGIIATESERRWLLMAACGGRVLEDVIDVGAWERAVARYARLQIACIPRVRELRALGCGERTLEALANTIGSISNDIEALRPEGPDGLTPSEIDRLQSLVPELQRSCAELAACGIPFTLEHGDLWPGNFLVTEDSTVIIDWEDVAISHPFFSLAPFRAGLALSQPTLGTEAAVESIERAYLAAFDGMTSPERLGGAVRLATPLAFIDMAARYRQYPPSVVRLHPWMRDLVPQALRLALARVPAE